MKKHLLLIAACSLALGACSDSADNTSAAAEPEQESVLKKEANTWVDQTKKLGSAAVEATKETSSDIVESSKDYIETAKDAAGDAYESTKTKSAELYETAKEKGGAAWEQAKIDQQNAPDGGVPMGN